MTGMVWDGYGISQVPDMAYHGYHGYGIWQVSYAAIASVTGFNAIVLVFCCFPAYGTVRSRATAKGKARSAEGKRSQPGKQARLKMETTQRLRW